MEELGVYEEPVFVTSDPADPDRLFVVERAGRILLTTGGSESTFLDMRSLVPLPGSNDLGLLSMAFAPDYAASGHLYVFYAGEAGELRVDEFTASGDKVALDTRRSVLEVDHPSPRHYGGQLQFGPDGYLYISTGDAGGGPGEPVDPLGSGQDLESLHSKLLRIDPRPSGGEPYSVPSGNPFVGGPGKDEIWSYGLRNPFRFSFDRLTGDLVIADVGQAAWEEIEYAPRSAGGGRGENYGWSCREGPDPYFGCAGTFTEPALSYGHSPGGYCSGAITGGYVVRDPGLPELLGRYLYADFCKGALRSLSLALPAAQDDRSEEITVGLPASFGEDSCGRLYVASILGPVYRLVGDGGQSACMLKTVGPVQGPAIRLRGKRSQILDELTRVAIAASTDKAATIKAKAIVEGAAQVSASLGAKVRRIPAGAERWLSWRLGRISAERYRRLLLDGYRIRVRFRATAFDALGNGGTSVERVVRLIAAG